MNTHPPLLRQKRRPEPLKLMGGEVIPYFTGHDNAGRAFAAMNVYPPGTGVPLHTHTLEDEIFHVAEGSLEITLGEKNLTLQAGDSAFLPRDVPHAWQVAGDQVARFLLVVTPAGMESMFREVAALGEAATPQKVASICDRYGIAFA
jgi:quercetin dioxygenase-like cupin family protein